MPRRAIRSATVVGSSLPRYRSASLQRALVGMIKTANFGFLAVHDSTLAMLGGLAERYFREDPPTCLIKLRQFAELVAKLVAAHTATYAGERETFEETLRRRRPRVDADRLASEPEKPGQGSLDRRR